MTSTLVGMFDTQSAAMQARDQLTSAGFAASAISMTGGADETPSSTSSGTAEPHREGAISRFFSSIFGDSDEERADASRAGYTETYTEAFRRGAYGVSVTATSESEMDRAEEILDDCGAVDIDERAASWREEGWAGGSQGAYAGGTAGALAGGTSGTLAGTGLAGASETLAAGDTRKLQEVEEELKVGKRAVSKGGVRIYTRTTAVPVSETVRLREEHASVRRTAVDRPATEADLAAFKEGSIEVREMAEEAVVSKTARVTGEVEIGKTATERDETVSDTVRKTQVDVEQIGGGTASVDPLAVRDDERLRRS